MKLGILFLLSCLFLIIVIFGAYLWWMRVNSPVDIQDKNPIKVIIPQGYGVEAIGRLLVSKGLIRSPLAFRFQVIRNNLAGSLQAGSYELYKSQNLSEIVESLTKGIEDFWVMIPEGKRREEVAVIFKNAFSQQNLAFSTTKFIDLSIHDEGYLFPDSYLLPKTASETIVIQLMKDNFNKKVSLLNQKFSPQEIIILASLIEREAKHKEDRLMIAGVLLNRLRIGMALQVDATIQYAIGDEDNWWPVVSDTSIRSQFNTYLINGLPPAPICNPGLESIKAVINPDVHEYFYYLSEPSGKTHYAKTQEEHEANIEKYLN